MSGEVVARLHGAREDARHFRAALAEVGDDDADALLSLLEAGPRPPRRRFELELRGGERRAGVGARHRIRRAVLGGEAREELAGLRRHGVERVSHDERWGLYFR